ncbi:CoA ester lyase [Aneurinibacillus sp. BA2021]|nr:CoA ester lyase [Aneurinibacillus sp. BA2021]
MTLWRSWMFVPGNQKKKLEKSMALDADVIVYDLEDAVPLQEKPAARMLVRQAVERMKERQRFVRINDVSTPYFMDDLTELATCDITGVMLPKAAEKEQIHLVDHLLRTAEEKSGRSPGSIMIVPLIETALGLHRAFEIASASPRVHCLAFGAVDYTLDIGTQQSKEGTEILFARSWLVNVSRAAGINPPIDGVYVDIHDSEGLRQETAFVKQLGFQGKLAIHPAQYGIINAEFAPTEEQIHRARKIVAAFANALEQGQAAVEVDGKMVDYPVAIQARKTLEMAKALGKTDIAGQAGREFAQE